MASVDSIPKDQLLEVKAFLRAGDLIALPQGTMAAVFRVVHDDVEGETDFEWLGIAALTGAQNTVRREKVDERKQTGGASRAGNI